LGSDSPVIDSEQGVDGVVGTAREVVSAHAVFSLEVTLNEFDRGASSHLAIVCSVTVVLPVLACKSYQ
jgi:hypothetical protein